MVWVLFAVCFSRFMKMTIIFQPLSPPRPDWVHVPVTALYGQWCPLAQGRLKPPPIPEVPEPQGLTGEFWNSCHPQIARPMWLACWTFSPAHSSQGCSVYEPQLSIERGTILIHSPYKQLHLLFCNQFWSKM
jgi:hypothetical protein